MRFRLSLATRSMRVAMRKGTRRNCHGHTYQHTHSVSMHEILPPSVLIYKIASTRLPPVTMQHWFYRTLT